MSRCRRKTPIFGNTTTSSEKEDKRIANRAMRRVHNWFKKRGEVKHTDTWIWGKDGKHYWKDAPPEAMRK